MRTIADYTDKATRTIADYTDKAIMRVLVEQLLKNNPLLKLGDKLDGPTARVMDGKLFVDQDDLPPANAVSIQHTPGISIDFTKEPMPCYATAGTKGFGLQDFEDGCGEPFDLELTKLTWLHPYTAELPNRQFLETYKVGDKVSLGTMNHETFRMHYVEVPVTKEMIIENSNILFRFALVSP